MSSVPAPRAGGNHPALVGIETGEVRIGYGGMILECSALGSCVAVAVLDCIRGIGGLCHIMLPGESPAAAPGTRDLRYAEDAIGELVRLTGEIGSAPGDLAVCLAGGGNVLRRLDDTICTSLIRSVRDIVHREKLRVTAESLGGIERRRVRVDVADRRVWCSVGDEAPAVLWECRMSGPDGKTTSSSAIGS